MKEEAERVGAQGGKRLAAERLAEEVPEQQARNLLLMQRRKDKVLRFLIDLAVPFDNNQVERDLWMVKL